MRQTKILTLALLFTTGVSAQTQKEPKVVQNLIADGVEISGTFSAPNELTGYVGHVAGQPVSFYLTPDKKHVIFGTMMNEKGENISERYIEEMVIAPMNQNALAKLEAAHWTLDGSPDAKQIIYTFTDPNCPYCHRFRTQASPWIDAGLVQFRHIVVGILAPSSLEKAAVILASEDPEKALGINRERHGKGGIKIDKKLVAKGTAWVEENNKLMRSLGLFATPSSYYFDEKGDIQYIQGLPQGKMFATVMGSPKPK